MSRCEEAVPVAEAPGMPGPPPPPPEVAAPRARRTAGGDEVERSGQRGAEGDEHAGMAAPPVPAPMAPCPAASSAVAPDRWPMLRARSSASWMRLVLAGLLLVLIGFAFYKWGLPFVSEKVLLPIMKWETKSFGRPMLALVLVASLGIFPVVFLPSSPSMWLTGIIFGYGFGFLIIMTGTAIGMSIPYLIGSLFRERLHGWLEKKWPKEIALVKLAAKGSWFKQSRVVALLRISPFPYAMLNYAVTVTQIKFSPYICGSVVGMVPESFVNMYSGRLILTLADLKYHNHRMTTVEIVYNAISVTVAVLVAIGFTIYAKRALDDMQNSEGICPPEPADVALGSVEFRDRHQECSNSSSVTTDAAV